MISIESKGPFTPIRLALAFLVIALCGIATYFSVAPFDRAIIASALTIGLGVILFLFVGWVHIMLGSWRIR